MKNSMYLVKRQNNWYQLRETSTHTVLACGNDLSAILNTARKYVLRYGNSNKFLKALDDLEYTYIPKDSERELRENEFEGKDEYLNSELDNVVKEALIEYRKNTTLNKVKTRLSISKRRSTTGISTSKEQEVKDYNEKVMVTQPKLLGRRSLLKKV